MKRIYSLISRDRANESLKMYFIASSTKFLFHFFKLKTKFCFVDLVNHLAYAIT